MGIKPDIAQKEVIARIITTGMDTKPVTAQKVATPPTITTGTGTKPDIAQKEVIARTITTGMGTKLVTAQKVATRRITMIEME